MRLPHQNSRIVRGLAARLGMTLVEVIVVMAIIAILASMVLGALFTAQSAARETKTRALIAKLNSALMPKWESYRTRRLTFDMRELLLRRAGLWPVDYSDQTEVRQAQRVMSDTMASARLRMECLWELQRMEFPDSWYDILDPDPSGTNPPFPSYVVGMQRPAISRALYRLITNPPVDPTTNLPRVVDAAFAATDDYQDAECLYLILTMGMGEESLSSSQLADSEVGDFDRDGWLEFHDGWGRPISFLRWAPGFVSELQPLKTNANGIPLRQPEDDPDPLDYLRVTVSPNSEVTPSRVGNGYRLVPLIYSSGPDGLRGLMRGSADDSSGALQPLRVRSGNTIVDMIVTDGPNGTHVRTPYANRGLSGLTQNGYQLFLQGGSRNPFDNVRGQYINNGYDPALDNIHNHLLGIQ